MITKLQILFEPNEKLRPDSCLASLFQGVLMQKVSEQFAAQMHISAVRPYSQYITNCDDRIVWTVCTLNKNTRKNIIDILLSDSFRTVCLDNKNITLKAEEKKLTEVSYSELLDKYYLHGESSRYISLQFLTQTAFKRNGKYVIMPDSQMILNNLIRKFDCVCEQNEIYDDMLAEYITEHTEIVEYCLRSRKYSMEGITIPSFTGTVKLKLGGNKEFICLSNMLLDFAQYSGIGIKTAMGMGACQIVRTGGTL